MNKVVLLLVLAVTLGVLLVVGVRDIRKFSAQSSSATSDAAGSQAGAGSENLETIKFVKNPEPAPAFSVNDLDGHPMSPGDWRGKVVLLNFWATWCAPCREEIPDLIKLQAKYAGQLQIVGLSDDSGSVQQVKNFVHQAKMNYPIALASPDLEQKFGGVMGLPTSFLLDTEGRVVQKHVGLRNPALYDLEIRALLQLPVKAKVETFTDTGQVFLSNVKNATELPGVDMSKLTPEQKKIVLHKLNEGKCTCSCGLTLAQCRINDSSCGTSQKLAYDVVQAIVADKE